MEFILACLFLLAPGTAVSLLVGRWVSIMDEKRDKKNIEWGKEEDKKIRKREEKRRIICGLHIIGHEQFKLSVNKVLAELKENAPERYREVVIYLPKAEYVSYKRDFSGRADGLFTVDGSGDNIGQVNTYERFRWVFLHEVGHNVSWYRMKDHSEDAANEYARVVLKEIALAKNEV